MMITADEAHEIDILHADSHSLATLLLLRGMQVLRGCDARRARVRGAGAAGRGGARQGRSAAAEALLRAGMDARRRFLRKRFLCGGFLVRFLRRRFLRGDSCAGDSCRRVTCEQRALLRFPTTGCLLCRRIGQPPFAPPPRLQAVRRKAIQAQGYAGGGGGRESMSTVRTHKELNEARIADMSRHARYSSICEIFLDMRDIPRYAEMFLDEMCLDMRSCA